ncbi:hypothetical protein BDM02DRAFT_1736799 [Thelephora ganbajun]|uniref:Uncharacterized protein n=1 Tax=Thelephora ganbajun TaxID=370292 RepID=A0ACB6ZK42_THEGA|nr:hypothetical protein BDM02DRAFT_1736799 [Thelephora ganbajun]
MSLFNAQHDCEDGDCGYAIHDASTQDGQATANAKEAVIHSAHNKFFIDFHALHSAWRPREVLPETSQSLCHTSPIARSFAMRWQENCRRLTPESVKR